MAIKIFYSKKAMIFTLIAILLIAVLIAQAAFVTTTTYKQKSSIALARVNTMNDFIQSVEQDVDRSMSISGYRSLISIQKIVAENGTFFSELNPVFEEAFINGTYNGTPLDLLEDASIMDWADRVNTEANKMNINVEIIPRSVYVYHITPWVINIEMNATMNITDANNLASWHYNKTFVKSIEIVSFEDPLYTVKSNDRVTNLILRANDTQFVNPSNNDTTVLYEHLNNSFYVESETAPSFLMRFTGNLSASPFGIESLVNVQEFSNQDLPIFDNSVIDYEYFNPSYDNSDDYCNFPGMPSWFRMDQDRISDYNLSGLGVACP